MKRTAAPRGLLEFPASGQKQDICPSAAEQHTVHAPALFLSATSINLATAAPQILFSLAGQTSGLDLLG